MKKNLRQRRALSMAKGLVSAGYKINPDKASLPVLEHAMRHGPKLLTTTRTPIRRTDVMGRTLTLPITERVPAVNPYAARVRSAFARRVGRRKTA